MIAHPLLRQDLDHVLTHAESIWRDLAGARLFITGGTGFFGKWLLESIAHANDSLGCGIKVTILTRNSAAFWAEMPHLRKRTEFCWLNGDVTDFAFPVGDYDFIFHLATFTSAHLEKIAPQEMLTAKFLATQRVLNFARHCKARRVLVASSGAVYGPQPATLESIPEDYEGAPNPLLPSSAYGNGKRMVEQLCAIAPDVDVVIARCFTFLGPHLPLDARYAAGNFLRDAMAGNPIIIESDGSALRSYLHPADLVYWLLGLLHRGQKRRAYNVGSQEVITIRNLANRIAAATNNMSEVRVLLPPSQQPPQRYVPNTTRVQDELGLLETIALDDAIVRTLRWHSHLKT